MLALDGLRRYLNQILFLVYINPLHLSKTKKRLGRKRMQNILISKSLKKNMFILA